MTKDNVKRKVNRGIAFVLAAIIGLSSPLSAYAFEAVKTSNYVISKVDTARAELETLARSRSIAAAIYRKDSYIVKSMADQYSEDVISLASGQSVSIISVDVDEGRNIWYKIKYTYAGTTITGFVEREFLASSDTRFLSWEDKYITTINREAIRNTKDCSDIEAFPESYRDALYELRKTHPNWRFVKQEVGLDWNTVIKEEATGEKSLISGSADSSFKEKPSTGTAGWYVATKGIISYYMDPRNFLTQEPIFMFEQETYNAQAHNSATVAKVLGGTFMSGAIPNESVSYADAFVNIGAKLNMSPIALASRVKQEQGVNGTSPLISGTYKGYEGYYNYFNVKANGATKELIYQNGLTYAKNAGWNTRVKSLEGGASLVANSYVKRGQDTPYLQKFDVDNSDNSLYTHQYMQNISAPYSEGLSTYKAYSNAGFIDNPFVFKIPVYKNMPSGRCIKPNATDVISLNVDKVENLPVDQNAVLISLINGGQNTDVPMTFDSSNKNVATVDNNGVVTGITPGSATISVKRTENTTNVAKCTINVIKADIAISKVDIPQINVVYDPNAKLSSIELPADFAWVDGSIVPTVSNEGYSVTYSPDNSKYNKLTLSIPVLVAKATTDINQVSIPNDLTIDAGKELSTVELPSGFAWADETLTAPKKLGNVSFDAVYCEDGANYEPVNVQITIEVICETHEYGEWSGTPVSCEQDGDLTRTCEICGDVEQHEEKATGHDYVFVVTKEATTEETGIRTYTCTKCHDEYEKEIPKVLDGHTHEYVEEVTTEAGCFTTGLKTLTCSCKDSYTETIYPLGHSYNDDNVCVRCGYELPVVPEHIHEYTFSNNTATCTEDGENIYICGCGDSYSTASKKTGHSIRNGVCRFCGYDVVKKVIKPKDENGPIGVTKPTASPEPTAKPTPTRLPAEGEDGPIPTRKLIPTPTPVPTKRPGVIVLVTKLLTEADEAKKGSYYKSGNANEIIDDTENIDPAREPIAEDLGLSDNKPVSIVMMSSTVLNKDKIEEYVSEENKRLEITMANDVVWDVDLSSVNDYAQIDVNLAVSFDDADIPMDIIANIAGDNDYRTVDLKFDGKFPCPVTLKLPVEDTYVGKVANLFYYNPSQNCLEYVNECTISDDCMAAYDMEHASAYVMIYNDISMDPGIIAAIDKRGTTKLDLEEPGVDSSDSTLPGGTNILLYGGIAIIVILMISLCLGVLIYTRDKSNDLEEEDE